MRTCVGCRRRAPQHELVRCVVDDDHGVRVDRTAAGRGAWICGPECAASARRARGFERAWRRQVPAAALEGIEEMVDRSFRSAEGTTAVRSGSTRHERLTTRVKG